MTEYRLVGSAIVNQKRERVVVTHEFERVKPGRAEFERFFSYYCANRDYREPDLVDWDLA